MASQEQLAKDNGINIDDVQGNAMQLIDDDGYLMMQDSDGMFHDPDIFAEPDDSLAGRLRTAAADLGQFKLDVFTGDSPDYKVEDIGDLLWEAMEYIELKEIEVQETRPGKLDL